MTSLPVCMLELECLFLVIYSFCFIVVVFLTYCDTLPVVFDIKAGQYAQKNYIVINDIAVYLCEISHDVTIQNKKTNYNLNRSSVGVYIFSFPDS